MRKVIYVIIVFAVMLCSGLPAQAEMPVGELRVGLPTLYDQTFHPIWGTLYRKQYLEPMYDFIIGVDKDGNFDPKQSVAYKWEKSPDLRTWTLYIRDGIKFHNGDPLTAEDVAYTIEQGTSKKDNAGAGAAFKSHIDRVETTPPNKVVVHLKKPWPTFPYYLSTLAGAEGMIQPKRYIEAKGDKYFMTHPIGSGPYKFYEWKEGVHIKFVAQNSHWRVGTPKYKYLTFKLMPEAGTQDAALRSGEIDVIATSLSRAEGLEKDGFIIQSKKDGILVNLGFLGLFDPGFPTHKKEVRQALIYAINKDEIVKQILNGRGMVVGCAVPIFTWSVEYKPFSHTPYDPKKAKELLAEAGYPKGFTMYLYSFVTRLPETRLINETIAAYWEAIGVKVKILEMNYSAFKPIWTKKKKPQGPAAFILAYPNRPVYDWRVEFYSTAMYSHIKDLKLDRLIEDFEGQSNLKGYKASSRKAMDYFLANYYGTGICTTNELYALDKKVPRWKMGKGMASYRWEYIGKE
ncbi:MAG: ABC transporter substrate-binding protein [Deltaproteobacteria bacterium]|nr:ABC transporter substrate-binding protein [Deltaproteobacteria bacterium]